MQAYVTAGMCILPTRHSVCTCVYYVCTTHVCVLLMHENVLRMQYAHCTCMYYYHNVHVFLHSLSVCFTTANVQGIRVSLWITNGGEGDLMRLRRRACAFKSLLGIHLDSLDPVILHGMRKCIIVGEGVMPLSKFTFSI